jgi:hypothetical protein
VKLRSAVRVRVIAKSLAILAATVPLLAGGVQGGRAGGTQPQATTPPPTARTAAPIDLTGYWVSVVNEDWRWRMLTPAKGDVIGIPLTKEGFTTASVWDPAKDEAAGEQCRGYGAPGLMRLPGRLHITWQDEQTLKVEMDYGTQTRLLRFPTPVALQTAAAVRPAGPRTWQGSSAAQWDIAGRGGRGRGAAGGAPRRFGSLTVTTTNLRPGYLRKNGVPYSEETVLTEYWDLLTARSGDDWLVITSIVHDPKNLQIDWVTSLNFKKEADGSKWDPEPCAVR